jgi:hypothetical protein
MHAQRWLARRPMRTFIAAHDGDLSLFKFHIKVIKLRKANGVLRRMRHMN